MALRLFQIIDTSTGKPANGKSDFYSDKKQAKAYRQKLNEEHGSETRFIVSPGPDHRNYKG